jgi:peroxiredoxin
MNKALAIGALIAFATTVLTACQSAGGIVTFISPTGDASAATTGPPQVAQTPEAATPFTVQTLDGGTWKLADQRGKVVVLNFWASWCIPCRAEMPAFERVWQRYRDRDVAFLGLSVTDTLSAARDFVSETGVTYPTALDEGEAIALSFRVTGLPTTLLVDRDGIVRHRWLGALDEDRLVTLIEDTLNESASERP